MQILPDVQPSSTHNAFYTLVLLLALALGSHCLRKYYCQNSMAKMLSSSVSKEMSTATLIFITTKKFQLKEVNILLLVRKVLTPSASKHSYTTLVLLIGRKYIIILTLATRRLWLNYSNHQSHY